MNLAYNFYRVEHYEDIDTKIQRLHNVGVREAVIIFGIRPHKHNVLHPIKVGGTSPNNYVDWMKDFDKMLKLADKAREFGWAITIKPHFHSQDRDDLGNLKWWSGFCIFENQERVYFESFMKAFFQTIVKEFNPECICIENEMLQMLYEEDMWVRIIESIPTSIKKTVALNFFQPYKEHWAWKNWFINKYLITEGNAKKYISDFGFDKRIVEGVKWEFFKNEKPKWIDLLDEIGFNAYCFPTYNNTNASVESIMKVYKGYTFYHKILFWNIKITLDYPNLLEKFAGVKPWRVTEIDVIAGSVKGDWEAYKRWWKATFNIFENTKCTTLSIWDDRAWGWWIRMMEENGK